MVAKPLKSSRIKTRNSLTPQQQKFVEAFFEVGGNTHKAGEIASNGSNPYYGGIAMNNANVRRVIREETERRINFRLLPLTHWALERILSDPKTPGAAIVAASKLVWETAGAAGTAGAGAGSSGGKELHEMTIDEMEGELRRLRDMADRRLAATTSIDIQTDDVEQVEPDGSDEVDPFA